MGGENLSEKFIHVQGSTPWACLKKKTVSCRQINLLWKGVNNVLGAFGSVMYSDIYNIRGRWK